MEFSTIAQRDSGFNSAKIMPEDRRSFHQAPSPDRKFYFSNEDEGHSSASSSPYNGLSQASSRSSSSTRPSFTGEDDGEDDAKIGSIFVRDGHKRLAKILGSWQPERANSSKEKHKFDERRRRDQHKQLQGLAEDLCRDRLDLLQDSSLDDHGKDWNPQLLRAMMTGNHKKHNTKTAILVAVILQLLGEVEIRHQQTCELQNATRHIQLLEHMLQSAGISLPEVGGVDSFASPTNKRRKTSLVVGMASLSFPTKKQQESSLASRIAPLSINPNERRKSSLSMTCKRQKPNF